MLHSHYPSSGWSSTHTGFSGLSGRSQPSSYLNPRNRHSYIDTSRLSGRPVSPPYQPSKYGLPSDLTYNSSVGDGNYRNSNFDEEGIHRENGYERSSSYGYIGQEFDFGPYRSNTPRSTDYSSDTGGPYRKNVLQAVDYSSDSGRGQGHVSRNMTDYSSDSGLNYRRQRRRSSEFVLDVPSPIMSRKERTVDVDEELYASPVKVPPSEFSRLKENRRPSANSHHDIDRNDVFSEYHASHRGRISPNSSRNTSSEHIKLSPRPNKDHDSRHINNHEHSFENETSSHSEDHSHINQRHPVDIDQMLSRDTDHTQSHDTGQVQSHDSNHNPGNPQSHGTNHTNTRDIDRSPTPEISHNHSGDNTAKHDRSHNDDSDPRPDFMSPPLYRGRSVVNDQSKNLRLTKKPPLKASDLTHWQQRQRSHDTHVEPEDQVHIVLQVRTFMVIVLKIDTLCPIEKKLKKKVLFSAISQWQAVLQIRWGNRHN